MQCHRGDLHTVNPIKYQSKYKYNEDLDSWGTNTGTNILQDRIREYLRGYTKTCKTNTLT